MQQTTLHKLGKWRSWLSLLPSRRSWRLIEFPDQVGRNPAGHGRPIAPPPLPDLAPAKRRIGSTRTGRRRIGTGSTMQVRAPRLSRCPTPGLSRWNSRASTCSPDPACSGQQLPRTVWFPAKPENHPYRRGDLAPLRLFDRVRRQDRAGAGARRGSEADAGREFRRPPRRFRPAGQPPDPITGQSKPDMIGLSCAACHTGHINYKGVSVRFDGGPGMVDLMKLEIATGLSIGYTLNLPTVSIASPRGCSVPMQPDRTHPAQRRSVDGWRFLLGQAKTTRRP